MGQLKLIAPAKVQPLKADALGEDNTKRAPKANGHRPGDIEPPLPLTPQRIELIKAYANGASRRTVIPSASQIAQRFAPRAQAAAPRAERTGATPMPLAPPLLALAAGIRRLAAVLILVAVLPNLVLGALFWLGPSEAPSPAAVSSDKSGSPVASPAKLAPVLSAPALLHTKAGEQVAFNIALDGTDSVPAGSAIVVSGLPQGSSLSSGRQFAEAAWSLEPDDIGDLHLALPSSAAGQMQIAVHLLAANGSIIADAVTVLVVTAEPEPDRVVSAPEPGAAATDLSSLPADETPATAAAEASDLSAASESELVPLPTRRPPPPDESQGNWISPTAYVNLREGPSSSARVVRVVAKGTKLRVLGRKRGWLQVADPDNAEKGWIYSGNADAIR